MKLSFTLVNLEHNINGNTVKSRMTCWEIQELINGVNRIWAPAAINFVVNNCQTRQGIAPANEEEFFQDEDEDLSKTEELFLESAWRDKNAHINVYIVPMIVNTEVLGGTMKKSSPSDSENELKYIILSEFSSYSGGEPLPKKKLEYILAHELGHCLHVEHPDEKDLPWSKPNSLMTAYSNPELTQEYLSTEEINMAREYARTMQPFKEKTQTQMLTTTWLAGEERNYKNRLGKIRF